jgi:hypothetical protein
MPRVQALALLCSRNHERRVTIPAPGLPRFLCSGRQVALAPYHRTRCNSQGRKSGSGDLATRPPRVVPRWRVDMAASRCNSSLVRESTSQQWHEPPRPSARPTKARTRYRDPRTAACADKIRRNRMCLTRAPSGFKSLPEVVWELLEAPTAAPRSNAKDLEADRSRLRPQT